MEAVSINEIYISTEKLNLSIVYYELMKYTPYDSLFTPPTNFDEIATYGLSNSINDYSSVCMTAAFLNDMLVSRHLGFAYAIKKELENSNYYNTEIKIRLSLVGLMLFDVVLACIAELDLDDDSVQLNISQKKYVLMSLIDTIKQEFKGKLMTPNEVELAFLEKFNNCNDKLSSQSLESDDIYLQTYVSDEFKNLYRELHALLNKK